MKRAITTVTLARVVTYSLLGALVLVAGLNAEIWPLSAFRLFSQLRTGESVTWEVATVTGDGHVTDVALPSASSESSARVRGAHHVLPRLGERPVPEQRRVLGSYLRAAGVATATVAAVRVYRVVRRTPTNGRGPGPVLRRRVHLEVRW